MVDGTENGTFDIVSSGYIAIEGKHKKTKKPKACKSEGNNYISTYLLNHFYSQLINKRNHQCFHYHRYAHSQI